MTSSFKIISPVDGSVYLERFYARPAEIEKALQDATARQRTWRQTTIEERAKVCRKVIEYFEKHAEVIAEEITWQMGRPICYTPFEITKGFKERALHMIEEGLSVLRDKEIEQGEHFHRFIRKEPLGTVMVLSPWNYPYLTAVNAVIPAIMAGNTVILKHADQTARCSERFAEAFAYAGAPAGVFQFLHLSHDQIPAILQDNRIAGALFTGSVSGGKAVQAAMNGRFIPSGFELGGKDPAYVAEDADFSNAVENLVDGAFFNSGQSCCGIERIYVHQTIYDDFVERFKSLTSQYVVGDPMEKSTTLGPMVRVAAAERAQAQIDQAMTKGANPIMDADTFPLQKFPYFNPQVLVDVDHTMDVMTEESFAPLVGIMSVPTDEEAIALMNDSAYGLTASIWTSDPERALNMGDRIETGTWYMNRCDYLDPALAWTGVKNSGKGITLSAMGYDQLTRPKSFHLKLK